MNKETKNSFENNSLNLDLQKELQNNLIDFNPHLNIPSEFPNTRPNDFPEKTKNIIENKINLNKNNHYLNKNNNYENYVIYSKMKVTSNAKININNNHKKDINTGNSACKNTEKITSKFIGDELNSFINHEENNNNINNCDKCSNTKDAYKKAISIIKSYVDCINERLNIIYHKVVPQKKMTVMQNIEMDYSISPEFYHTMYYTEIDKFKLNSEVSFQLRSLMKSIRLFNDKYEYMSKKHENFEKMAQEYKNMKISNKTEDIKSIPEYDTEIKNLEVQKIFQNFNQAKESFENTLKEIKLSLNSNERNSITENKIFESENNIENFNNNNINNLKEPYLKNEVSRLVKENTSLRLELNYIYEQLKEENKIHAIYKSIPNKDSVLFSNSPDIKPRKKQHGRTDSMDSMNNSSLSNPILILPIKNDNKDEKFIIARSYIKRLKNSEYFFI